MAKKKKDKRILFSQEMSVPVKDTVAAIVTISRHRNQARAGGSCEIIRGERRYVQNKIKEATQLTVADKLVVIFKPNGHGGWNVTGRDASAQ